MSIKKSTHKTKCKIFHYVLFSNINNFLRQKSEILLTYNFGFLNSILIYDDHLLPYFQWLLSLIPWHDGASSPLLLSVGGQGDAVREGLWKSFCYRAQGSGALWGTDVIRAAFRFWTFGNITAYRVVFVWSNRRRRPGTVKERSLITWSVCCSLSNRWASFGQTRVFNTFIIKYPSCQTGRRTFI